MASRMSRMNTDAMCAHLGSFFATLANRTRMRIFCALQGEPRPVTAIAAEAGISIANASQHLRLMRDNGAVVSERRGQSVFYRIADRRFVNAASLICQALTENMRIKLGMGRHFSLKGGKTIASIRNESRPVRRPARSARKGALG